jgi:flagellar secretion chaperone FliS
MAYAAMSRGLNQYRQVAVHTGVAAATPHRLIQMLLEGALDRLASARGHIQRREFDQKSRMITLTIAIVEGLRASLNRDAGGDLANHLDSLYEYMTNRLFAINSTNDLTILEEVTGLLRQIKEGWDSIADVANANANSG